MENKDIIIACNTAAEQIRKLKHYAQHVVIENNKQLEDALNKQRERLQQAEQEVANKNAQIDELIARTTALANRTEENERVIEEYQGLAKDILDIILECAKDTLDEDNYRAVAGMDNIKNIASYMMSEMKKMADINKGLCKKVEELKSERVRECGESEAETPSCFGNHTREYGPCKARCMFGDKCEREQRKRKEQKQKERKVNAPDCIGDDVFKAECRVCPFILRCVELQAFRHRMRILLHHDW